MRPRLRDSYLHRSGLAPSPAADCSPRRRSEAGGSCALSCSSLRRTSAWWGAVTAGTAALPLQAPGTAAAANVTPESPAGRWQGGDLREAPRPPVRAGGAGQEGPLARGGAPGGSAQVAPATAPGPARLAPSSRSADNSASNRPQPTPLPPALPLWSWGRPCHAPTAAAGLREAVNNSSWAPFVGRTGSEGAGGAVGCYPVLPSRRTAPPCLPPRRQPRQKRRQ